jgi:plastocyanin
MTKLTMTQAIKRIARLAALLGTLALAAVWIGCGSKSGVSDEPAAPPITTVNPSGKPVDSATAGSIAGMILLDGAPPAPKTLNMKGAPPCAKQHEGDPAKAEDVVPGDGGTLQNVVVYLKGDFGAYSFAVPQTPAVLDQVGCQFRPHVLALMTGQPLDVSSADKVGHNVNAMAKTNAPWNHTLAPAGKSFRQSFAHPEVALPVKCNIHPWMKAYIAVLDSPYFAVTGKDGSFALRGVPPGTYTLTAWQESYGSTEQSIVVAPHESKTVNLTFKSAASSD